MTAANAAGQSRTQGTSRTAATSRDSINAGLGGAGGGTGLIALAQQFGLHTVPGMILIYAAPAFSVIAGALFYELKLRAEWYTEKSKIKKARKTMEELLKSPHTSDEHKAKIRNKLEQLDQAVADGQLARIKSMRRS